VQDYQQHNNVEKIENILKNLNLENVGMIQFCGGETLLGNTYWQTAELLAKLIPDAKNNLELGFQTNGTQPIDPRWFDLIEKFKLVKLMISIDGVGDRFEYLRWPASWNQTVDNILTLRETLPSNVMFFVQECTSCLNMHYFNEVGDWVKQNFATNREGDRTDHSTQLAVHSYLNVRNITQEYIDALAGTPLINAIGSDWQENPNTIVQFIKETEKFDKIRGQDWKKTFPEVAEFYRRYL
jgi:sulfatase maturation enzyme AslB (radical SAM superfamily)